MGWAVFGCQLSIGGCSAGTPGPIVDVPAGEVLIGRKIMPGFQGPVDQIRVKVAAFRIDRTEVTQAAYARFVVATGYRPPFVDEPWAHEHWSWTGQQPPAGKEDHPVVLVNVFDGAAYCAWAGGRLPTEAEWQLAALGPVEDGRAYPWGGAWALGHANDGQAAEPNYDESDGYLETSPVGAFPAGASWVGAQDMFGNAWEWTADVERLPNGYALYGRVRGGSYFFDLERDLAEERNAFPFGLRRKTSGFRCAYSDG